MKIELWTVGKTRMAWLREGEAHYLKRCRRFAECTVAVIPSERSGDPSTIIARESQRLMDRLQRTRPAVNILLSDSGHAHDSHGFAKELDKLAIGYGGRLRFIIGGAYGVSGQVRVKMERSLSLSPMTFPHELVRVVFLEQLYRAFTILRGESYHHG